MAYGAADFLIPFSVFHGIEEEEEEEEEDDDDDVKGYSSE